MSSAKKTSIAPTLFVEEPEDIEGSDIDEDDSEIASLAEEEDENDDDDDDDSAGETSDVGIDDEEYKKNELENDDNASTATSLIEDDSDNEDDPENENCLQKFNDHLQLQDIESAHPELNQCNYDEMIALSRIVRDGNGKIIDPLHRTLPFLTKYEKARIIGARAEQIERGGKPFVEVDPSIISGTVIAMREFDEKKIPFIICRPLPNGTKEYWNLKDLEIINE